MSATRPLLHLFASVLLLFMLLIPLARADESIFGYLYTTDSLPKDQWQYTQWNTLRTGKARGSYAAYDLRNEIEYGVTDRFQAALYLVSSFNHTRNVYNDEDASIDLPDQNEFGFNAIFIEFKYRVLSPYLDPIGLALYAEPEMGIRESQSGGDIIERAIEFRLILQKNFLDDTLVLASNIMLEPEWEIVDGESIRELWAELTFGVSYLVVPKWRLGVEFRNHREFPNMDFGQQEHSAFFVGPTVQYGDEKWWFSATVLPQLYGHPQSLGIGSDGVEVADSRLHLGQHEKLEVRFKFGIKI